MREFCPKNNKSIHILIHLRANRLAWPMISVALLAVKEEKEISQRSAMKLAR